MGRIFTPLEIEQGKVPKLESFPKLLRKIRERLTATKGIEGAVMCGSVLYGSHSCRSDLDCVVVYDHQNLRAIMKVFGDIVATAAQLYIPLELISTDIYIARRTTHSIGGSFKQHLEFAVVNGGMIKADPLKFFSFGRADMAEDFRGYLSHKRQKLEKGLIKMGVMEDGELCQFLQKVLEVPMHVARKMLYWKGAQLADDSKKAVTKHYLKTVRGQEKKIFESIIALDERYSAELDRQLKYENKNQYLQAIEEIKSAAPAVLEFLRLNAFRLP